MIAACADSARTVPGAPNKFTGLIKQFCMPNAVFTFKEYLSDFASPETKARGEALIAKILGSVKEAPLHHRMIDALSKIEGGEGDLYF